MLKRYKLILITVVSIIFLNIFHIIDFFNPKIIEIPSIAINIKKKINSTNKINDPSKLLYSHIFNNKINSNNIEKNFSQKPENNQNNLENNKENNTLQKDIDYKNLYISINAFNDNLKKISNQDNIFDVLENNINVYDAEINANVSNLLNLGHENTDSKAKLDSNLKSNIEHSLNKQSWFNGFINLNFFSNFQPHKKKKYYLTELQYFLTEQEAKDFIEAFKKKHTIIIKDYKLTIRKVEINDKFLFIVNSIGFKSFEEAKTFCTKLINHKEMCLVINTKI